MVCRGSPCVAALIPISSVFKDFLTGCSARVVLTMTLFSRRNIKVPELSTRKKKKDFFFFLSMKENSNFPRCLGLEMVAPCIGGSPPFPALPSC